MKRTYKFCTLCDYRKNQIFMKNLAIQIPITQELITDQTKLSWIKKTLSSILKEKKRDKKKEREEDNEKVKSWDL